MKLQVLYVHWKNIWCPRLTACTNFCNISALIQKLACSISFSIHDLHRQCLPSLFSRLLSNCEMWESYSLDLGVLMTLLSLFSGNHIENTSPFFHLYNFLYFNLQSLIVFISDDVFEFVFDELLKILNVILRSSSDKEIIFKSLYTLAALLNDGDVNQNKLECFEKIILGNLPIVFLIQLKNLIIRSSYFEMKVESIPCRLRTQFHLPPPPPEKWNFSSMSYYFELLNHWQYTLILVFIICRSIKTAIDLESR